MRLNSIHTRRSSPFLYLLTFVCTCWSALFQASDHHLDRPSKYPTIDGLKFEGIDGLAPISQVPKVEKQNNLDIYMFGLDKGI